MRPASSCASARTTVLSRRSEYGTAFVVEITTPADALACMQRCCDVARIAGFDEHGVWAIGIASSELATNIVRHAGTGRLAVALLEEPERGLEIRASDEGPGIEDVEAALQDAFSQGASLIGKVAPAVRVGLGSGLGAVCRLMDDFEIESEPHGTRVRAFKKLSQSHAALQTTPTLILGIGNPLLSDDGVGIRVARAIAAEGENARWVVRESETGGFDIIDVLEGFDRAIVIDAIRIDRACPGDVIVLDSASLGTSMHLIAAHQIDLPTALELGRRTGRHMPNSVAVIGVQIEDDHTFSETCTPAVTAAIPSAARLAKRIAEVGLNGVSTP